MVVRDAPRCEEIYKFLLGMCVMEDDLGQGWKSVA